MAIVVASPLPFGSGLSLCAIWLNDANDLADVCSFRYAGPSIGITPSLDVDVQQLVGRRILTGSDTRIYQSFDITLRRCDTNQVLWLTDHTGRLLCIRDPYGSKAYVVYREAPREIPAGFPGLTSVKLTLEQITHSEALEAA